MSTPAQPITGQDDQATVQGFASKVRAKFPGAYDDMDDVTLSQKIVAKHPEYADMLPKSFGTAPIAPPAPITPHVNMPGVHQYPERSAGERQQQKNLLNEAGSEGGIPLTVGARALESMAKRRDEAELSRAAKGQTAKVTVPPGEADIAGAGGQQIPFEDHTPQFLERSGADVMRQVGGMLTPSSLAVAGAAPFAPTLTGAALALHGGYNAAKNLPESVRGNPEAMQKMLMSAAEATGGGALAGEGVKAGAPDVKAAIKPFKMAAEAPGGALRSLGIIKPEPQKALSQAIQPGVNIPFAQKSIEKAGPRLQQVKNAGLVTDEEGNPIKEFKSNSDILQGVKAAKQYVYNAIDQRLGSVDKLQANTSEVGKAMENAIPKRIATQYPAVAERIRERAATYDTNMSFRDIEAAIQSANTDLRNFYKQPVANDKPISADTAATEAEVKALRSLLDEKMRTLTGSGVADLKREYGALRDVEKAAARQYAIETRQKGATLWEGLAALRAAGDFVSGNVLGSAKGLATMAAGRHLAQVRSPAWLIDQAFQGPKAFGPADELAPPPGKSIKGLLGPGPIITPAPITKSGPVDLGKPQVQPLAENRQLPPAGTTAGPRTVAGPSQYGISLPAVTPRPLVGPERQLPAVASPAGRGLPPDAQITPNSVNQTPPPFRMPLSSIPPESAAPVASAPPAPKIPPTAMKAAREAMKPTAEESTAKFDAERAEGKSLSPNELKLAKLAARETQEPTPAPRTREPKEQIAPEIAKDIETFNQAKNEIETMGSMWGAFERPGRYVHTEGWNPGDVTPGKPEVVVNSITGMRDSMESQFPWLKNLPKMTEGKLRAAIESGKGVEYNRLINEAGKHIQAVKAANAPVIEEFRSQLESAAEAVKDQEPDLAQTFRDILDGKYSSYRDLASYVKEKLDEAETADQFNEALSRGFEETPESGSEPREATESPKELGILPGLEKAVHEQHLAAGKEQARQMTEKINEPPKSIESAAGEMESRSPLFRGTGASPQNEMFAPGGELTTKDYDAQAHSDREAVRNHDAVSPNKYAQFVHQEESLPRSAKDRAAFWKRVRANLK